MKRWTVLILVIVLAAFFAGCESKVRPVQKYEPPKNNIINDDSIENPPEEVKIDIITTRENRTDVGDFTVEPKCVYGVNGGEIYFRTNKVPKDLYVELREPGERFKKILDKGNVNEGYITFMICKDCAAKDFGLLPDKIYILRFGVDMGETYPYYSNDMLINTSTDSEYFERTCQSKIKVVGWAVKE